MLLPRQSRIDPRCDNAHSSTGLKQHTRLALGDFTAADYKTLFVFDIKKYGQKIQVSPYRKNHDPASFRSFGIVQLNTACSGMLDFSVLMSWINATKRSAQ